VKISFKHTVAFVACLLACSLLCSCSLYYITEDITGDILTTAAPVQITTRHIDQPETPVPSVHAGYTYTPDKLLERLQSRDYGGVYFNIVTFAGNIFFTSDLGNYYYPASNELIKALERKFNILLIRHETDHDGLYDYISEELSDGVGYYADLAILPYSELDEMLENGYITGYDGRAFFDPEATYTDSQIMSMIRTDDGQTYALYTQTMCDPGNSYCVFFNKNIDGADGLYSSVVAGNWDLAAFDKAAQGRTVLYDEGFSEYAAQFQEGDFPASLSEDPLTEFEEGRADIVFARVSAIDRLAAGKTAFGILPLPKTGTGEGYSSYYGRLDDMFVIMLPASPASLEESILVADAFCMVAGDVFVNAAIEHYTDLVRDNASVSMLGYLFSKVIMPQPYETEEGHTGIAPDGE